MVLNTPTDPDVTVIGGGPSGSATATLLAQKGLKVELFERDHFPRFHIGESLIPHTYHVLKRLGMLPKMRESHFTHKHSVQFVTEHGKLSEPFYFHDHEEEEWSQTWQVRRAEFDHMLLTNAREHGVTVHEGARVLEVLFEGTRAVGIRVKPEGQPERIVKAKVIVDASGQSSLIIDKLNLREWDPELKKAAVWTYWKGAYRDEGKDAGATIVLQTKDKAGWFWYIPLHDDIISVGASAAYRASQAAGLVVSVDSGWLASTCLAAVSRSQARFLAGSPIQVVRLPSTQEPVCIEGAGKLAVAGNASVNSETVTSLIVSSSLKV